MRSVSSGGVAFVMRQFFRAIGAAATPAIPEIAVGMEHIASRNPGKAEAEKDICDDIILETWSNKPIDDSEESPNILLIGDSQMGMMAKVLDEQGIRYAGGAIMHGSEWHGSQFALLDDFPYFVPTSAEARSRWEQACEQSLLKVPESARGNFFILTNIGAHAKHIFSMDGIGRYLQTRHGASLDISQRVHVTADDLHNYLLSARTHHLTIINKFRKAGFNTIWISDPPLDPRNDDYYGAVEQILSEKYRAIGSLAFLARKWINDNYGALPEEFLSGEIEPSTGEPDDLHGSLEYYRQITKEVFHRFSIKPHYRQTAPGIPVGTKVIASNNGIGSGTDICDDIILETWSNNPINDSEEPPNILLLGDSQMGMMAKALDEQGIRYAGGAIMHGSEWHGSQFALLDDFPYFVPTSAEARSRWEQACEQSLLKVPESARSNLWIITNVGYHANDLATPDGFAMYLQNKHGAISRTGQMVTASIDDLRHYLLTSRVSHLNLVNKFRKAGFKTIWVSDPPVNLQNADLMGAAEQILSEEFGAIDSLAFLASKWISDEYGALPAEFLSSEIDPSTGQPDVIHGSLEYYRQLTKAIFNRFSIKPQQHQGMAHRWQ